MAVENPTVGFIGLGAMGGPMAANLVKAGFRVVVHDVRRAAADRHLAAGALWADSPRDVASHCQVILTCLPGIPQIETVVFGASGLLAGIGTGAALFETSTNSPEMVARLAVAFAAKGAHMLDAPVSGGALGAERGRLAMWVGGDRSVFDRFEPVLKAVADRPMHVGASGAGLVTKLVNNCASQTLYPVFAEIMALGVKAGADPLSLWAAIRQGALGRRRTFDGLGDEYLVAQFEPARAALRIMHKDMSIATALARNLGVPMRFASLALAEYTEAMNRGWAERDGRSVMVLAQERVGIEIAVAPEAVREVFRQDPPTPTDTKHGSGG